MDKFKAVFKQWGVGGEEERNSGMWEVVEVVEIVVVVVVVEVV
jgi:hypothetical protein